MGFSAAPGKGLLAGTAIVDITPKEWPLVLKGSFFPKPAKSAQDQLNVRALAFQTIAAGDSYNDTSMLGAADAGILFRPPENVIREFPDFPVTQGYEELREAFLAGEAQCAALA